MTLPTAPQGGIPFVDQDRTLSNSGIIFLQQLRAAIINIAGGGSGGGGGGGGTVSTRKQRSITSASAIILTDSILNINAATDLALQVPLASGRTGAILTFKNLPGSHIQTITATSPDTFDGSTTYLLAPGAFLTLVPYNDGVNSGYAIE